MARPSHDPSRAPTRERILRAGAQSFGDEGYAQATLATIGRRAGISRPSLLHHFPSKEALYREVVERAFADLTTALLAPRGGTVEQRIVALGQAFEEHLRQHPEHARILLRELISDGPGQVILTEQVAPLLARVTALVEVELGHRVRPEVPVRVALLQVASSLVVQAASPVRDALWGDRPHTEALIRCLLLPEED
jgi:AcrR family transcriptional regulator